MSLRSLVTLDTEDFPLTNANNIQGADMVVETLEERNGIPASYRVDGMKVTVVRDDEPYRMYRLRGGIANSDWIIYPNTGGGGPATEVIDNLVSTRTDAALSANMGKKLSDFKADVSALNNFYNKSEVDTKIAQAVTGGTVDLGNYYNKQEIDAMAAGHLTKNTADGYYQAKGNYVEDTAIADMATKTWANGEFQTKGTYLTNTDIADMATKTYTSQTYQPKGEYATTAAINDMATKTWANGEFQTKGNYAVATNVYTKTETYNQTEIDSKIAQAVTGGTVDLTSYQKTVDADAKYQLKGNYLDKATADNDYQPKGTYLDKNTADGLYQTQGNYLDKNTADGYYQPKGTYLTSTDINDMETQTHAEATYAKKAEIPDTYTKSEIDTKIANAGSGSDTPAIDLTQYLTTSNASNTYLSKTDASQTYQTKGNYLTNADLTGYLTTSDAAQTYQAKGTYLDKNTADATYQPLGTYLTNTDLNGYITETAADNKYQLKGTYLDKTAADSYYQPKGTYLDKSTADSYYQPKGTYVSSNDIADMATQTWANSQFQTKGTYLDKNTADVTYQPIGTYLDKATADGIYQAKGTYLDKSTADGYYQPKGTYLTSTDINDMATKTWANGEFQSKGNYLDKSTADGYYQPKGTYLTDDSTYRKTTVKITKDDLATGVLVHGNLETSTLNSNTNYQHVTAAEKALIAKITDLESRIKALEDNMGPKEDRILGEFEYKWQGNQYKYQDLPGSDVLPISDADWFGDDPDVYDPNPRVILYYGGPASGPTGDYSEKIIIPRRDVDGVEVNIGVQYEDTPMGSIKMDTETGLISFSKTPTSPYWIKFVKYDR